MCLVLSKSKIGSSAMKVENYVWESEVRTINFRTSLESFKVKGDYIDLTNPR